LISFEHVTKRYGERLALDDVTWRMEEGEVVCILGHSAAGKTTLLRLITHETQPTSGSVTVGTFRGRLNRTHRALLRRKLGIVYEDFRLLPDRSVFENVAIAVRIDGHFRESDVIPRTLRSLQEVGLQGKQTALPSELSYGERQRCAIARAIVNRPALILADEPTGALEPRSASEVLDLLKRVHLEGAALLVGTTRPEVADAVGGRRLILVEGRLHESKPGEPPGPDFSGPGMAATASAEPAGAPADAPAGARPEGA
jgi:cell division transport system ATP-binding protein